MCLKARLSDAWLWKVEWIGNAWKALLIHAGRSWCLLKLKPFDLLQVSAHWDGLVIHNWHPYCQTCTNLDDGFGKKPIGSPQFFCSFTPQCTCRKRNRMEQEKQQKLYEMMRLDKIFCDLVYWSETPQLSHMVDCKIVIHPSCHGHAKQWLSFCVPFFLCNVWRRSVPAYLGKGTVHLHSTQAWQHTAQTAIYFWESGRRQSVVPVDLLQRFPFVSWGAYGSCSQWQFALSTLQRMRRDNLQFLSMKIWSTSWHISAKCTVQTWLCWHMLTPFYISGCGSYTNIHIYVVYHLFVYI